MHNMGFRLVLLLESYGYCYNGALSSVPYLLFAMSLLWGSHILCWNSYTGYFEYATYDYYAEGKLIQALYIYYVIVNLKLLRHYCVIDKNNVVKFLYFHVSE